jgi:predicted site-specific integrase-resolvase
MTYFSMAEAIEILGVTRQTIHNWLRLGKIHGRLVCRKWYFTMGQLDDAIPPEIREKRRA